MYTFNWALTAFRSESYIGSAVALPDLTFLQCSKKGGGGGGGGGVGWAFLHLHVEADL